MSLFCTILEAYSTSSSLLDTIAQEIHDLHFVSAIFRVQEGQQGLFNITEKRQISGLPFVWEVLGEEYIADDSTIKQAANHLRGIEFTKRSQCLNTRFFVVNVQFVRAVFPCRRQRHD